MMKTAVFYCRDSFDNIYSMEYYNQDIIALESIGYKVIVCNRYRDIPFNFDVMFVWWWSYALIPLILAKILRKKCFVTGTFNFRFNDRGAGIDYFDRPFYQRILFRASAKLADRNLFVGKNEFCSVSEYFNLKNSIYFPHSIPDYYFDNLDYSKKNKELLFNVSWSGTDNLKRKGVWDIILAINLLKTKGIFVRLVLAGKEGDAFLSLKKRVSELGLDDRIIVRGGISLDEKIALYREASIYLQPSYYEGFGVATAEAMASGCCVITCDVGEVRNVVGDSGFYVNPGSPEEIADLLANLINNRDLVLETSKSAVKRIKDNFSFDRKRKILNSIV